MRESVDESDRDGTFHRGASEAIDPREARVSVEFFLEKEGTDSRSRYPGEEADESRVRLSLEEEGEVTSTEVLGRHGDNETDDTDRSRDDDVPVTLVRLVRVTRNEEGAAEKGAEKSVFTSRIPKIVSFQLTWQRRRKEVRRAGESTAFDTQGKPLIEGRIG